MGNNSYLIIGLLVSTFAVSCGPKVDSPISSNGPGGGPTPTPVVSAQAVTVGSLTGSWKQACASDPTTNGSSFEQLNFANNGSVASIINDFAAAGCSGAPDFTIQLNGTYSLSGLNVTVANATNLNLTISQVLMTPKTAVAITFLNATSQCGFTDWQVNTTKNIALNAPCLDGMPATQSEIIGIGSNVLYFGNETSTALDTSSGYTKQ